MKAARWIGKGKIELFEKEKPLINDDEILLKVKVIGICGTDIHIIDEKIAIKSPPLILGHEFSGEIVEIGRNVKGVKVGDSVAVESFIGCGYCYYCRKGYLHMCLNGGEMGITLDGGWQEYINVPYLNVHKLPNNMSFEQGAMVEMVSCPFGAIARTNIQIGDDVLVLGSGPAGLIFVQLAKLKGARKIILVGTRKERQLLGKEYGAEYLIDANDNVVEKVKQITDGIGVDVSIEAVGSEKTIKQAISCTRNMGKILVYGIIGKDVEKFPVDELVFKAIKIIGHQSSPGVWEETIKTIASGEINVDKMITHKFYFDEIDKAIKYSRDRIDGAIKVLLYF